ncbi:dicarboxylate/amino acid:cation symporter [Gluconacetobacter entanii]|uniref:Dicarboxylate/amino acid:cation symporter n=1 Tax=Gluconacetobacter entanii TaxID=108528 RepID=A0ABT3K6E7_9PROT|nr:dicarboxylate/amino acid:cation symporter [Gluconacetobacter entanii]MCW4590986.1 dicarboxylate/amino acid:cation symporter [Gluconacetobacter entanii]MCW4594479.1 dicarboxylate/amino acid:cation symporter [Gluconacetobacter entanii]NPC89562.1 dicarboxylate/amino acid:cation symporter [Gluconacetobacter entanii]
MIHVSPPPAPQRRSPFRSLYFQVIVAVVAGIAVGHFWPHAGTALKPLGDGFIRLVKMVIPPVIFLTVVTGVAGLSDLGKAGRLAGKAMVYFLTFSTLALVVGMLVANIVRPGAGVHADLSSMDTHAVAAFVARAQDHSFSGFVLNIIPDTVLSAFVSGDILQVLLIAILFSISLSHMGARGHAILSLFKQLTELVFGVVRLVMLAAPIGAFGAMAFTIGRFGIGSVLNLAFLVVTFYATSALFIVVVLGLVARYNGFRILPLLAYLREELLIVLGTSSSESALPTLMTKMENAGCAPSVVGLVVPMGYSFNLDGTNIYMSLSALFIAQATGVHLGLGQQVSLLLVAMVSSKGAAGVTGAGFVTLAATLAVVPDVPVSGMALILGIDRFMSECRSLTNIIGNAVATIVLARWENELDTQRLHAALSGSIPEDEADRPVLTSGAHNA